MGSFRGLWWVYERDGKDQQLSQNNVKIKRTMQQHFTYHIDHYSPIAQDDDRATNFNPIYHSEINNHSLLLSWFTLTPSLPLQLTSLILSFACAHFNQLIFHIRFFFALAPLYCAASECVSLYLCGGHTLLQKRIFEFILWFWNGFETTKIEIQ